MNWYLAVLKNYAVFDGRARRKEYWMFSLFNLIFLIVAIILDNVLGTAIGEVGFGLFYFLYLLAVLIPSIAVTVRRLHDVGKSGWMLLISLIPIIGAIWLFVLYVTDSNPGENLYGPNPKEMQSNGFAKDESIGDTLILIVVIWMFLSRTFWTILPNIAQDFFSTFHLFIELVWALIPLSLAFAVKNKSIQIALFIMGGIYFLYGLYYTIMQIVE